MIKYFTKNSHNKLSFLHKTKINLVAISTLLIMALITSSCSTQPKHSKIPVVDRSEKQPIQRPIKHHKLPTATVKRPLKPTKINTNKNAAVTSLLTKAGKQKNNKHYVKAGSTLERAIRISPRNAEIYYQLAHIRLLQQQQQQAKQLCLKAIVLAVKSPKMKARCHALGL